MAPSADLSLVVLHLAAGKFWLAVSLIGVLALGALWQALLHLRRRRIIEDTPTALIRSAPQGYIELRGMAELMDGDPIHAPLSLRRCVWFEYKVEHLERDNRHRRQRSRWVTVEQGTSDHLFYLIDTSGHCAIDPDGAAVTPGHRNVWYGNSRSPDRFDPADGVWWARLLGSMGSSYRYTEKRIEPGDQLYAIGNFVTHGGGRTTGLEHRHAAAVAERLREWKRNRQWLLREFDANRDGQIDMEEWSRARERAEAEVAAAQSQDAAAPPPVDVLGRTRDRRRPFVLAAGTEDALIRRSTWTAAALLCAAIPFLCATLWLISVRLNAS